MLDEDSVTDMAISVVVKTCRFVYACRHASLCWHILFWWFPLQYTRSAFLFVLKQAPHPLPYKNGLCEIWSSPGRSSG